jgi:hypothetical protein
MVGLQTSDPGCRDLVRSLCTAQQVLPDASRGCLPWLPGLT